MKGAAERRPFEPLWLHSETDLCVLALAPLASRLIMYFR
jgi:hypothetical protein